MALIPSKTALICSKFRGVNSRVIIYTCLLLFISESVRDAYTSLD